MSDDVKSCGVCGAPFTEGEDGHRELAEVKRLYDPYHACVSWTYVRGKRADEALLHIRKALKEAVGWWNDQDQRDYDEVVPT